MADSTFNPPADDRYFEDYVPGSVYEFGSILMEEKEMIDFATRYDPQAFHTDPDAARKSVFGGLIASGWHTGAVSMRLIVDHYLSRVASLGSLGIDECAGSSRCALVMSFQYGSLCCKSGSRNRSRIGVSSGH